MPTKSGATLAGPESRSSPARAACRVQRSQFRVAAFHFPPDCWQETWLADGSVLGEALGSLALIRAQPVSNAVSINAHATAFIPLTSFTLAS